MPSSGAVISEDGRYRYVLTRKTGSSRRAVNFIMLNPSTANATTDDNTITWCKNFAELEGFGRLYVTNLSPFRATSPRDMLKGGPEPQVVWKRNIGWVLKAASKSDLVILAWGNHGARTDRADRVLRVLRHEGHELYCLAITNRRQPRHPRGVSHGDPPVPFDTPGSAG